MLTRAQEANATEIPSSKRQRKTGMTDVPSAKHQRLDTGPDTVHLCRTGDVLITVKTGSNSEQKRFLVSSQVLGLASPVFARLFQGNMSEGEKLRNGESLCVELPEDDADAMEIIFRVLHHDPGLIRISKSLESLAVLAVHSDKYDCSNSLRPWVELWLAAQQSVEKTAVNLGLQLLIHFKLQASARFLEVSALAIKELPPYFATEWKGHQLLHFLPNKVESNYRVFRTHNLKSSV